MTVQCGGPLHSTQQHQPNIMRGRGVIVSRGDKKNEKRYWKLMSLAPGQRRTLVLFCSHLDYDDPICAAYTFVAVHVHSDMQARRLEYDKFEGLSPSDQSNTVKSPQTNSISAVPPLTPPTVTSFLKPPSHLCLTAGDQDWVKRATVR